ncbi:hypothetical protein P3S67_006721 [Capsicum chacoense]
MTSLIKHITNLPLITDASSEIDVQQQVRLYLLWIIGGMLAVDTSGNKVKLMYLHLLTDLSKVGQYAWGAATLAILYRYLCRASQKRIRVIDDFLPLLQVWIYERILPLRSRRDPDLLVDEWLISILPGPPRARVWSNGLCNDTEAPHLLYLFRDQLDLLMDHQCLEVEIWRDRRNCNAEPDDLEDGNEYVQWYNTISRHLINNPAHQFKEGYQSFAGRHEILVRTLHRIYRTTLSVQDSDNNELREFGDILSKLALNSFRVAGERGRGRIEAQYLRDDEYVEPQPQPRRRDRRREERPNYDRGEDAGTQMYPIHDHVSSDRPLNSFGQHFRGIAENIHASRLHYSGETSYNLNDSQLVLYQLECVTYQYSPRTPYQPTEFTDSDFYGHSPIIPDPNPRRMPPIDPVSFMLDLESQVDDNDVELESHVDDNGKNTLGVGSRRGGRPRGMPPGRSRFQNAPAIRRTRPDEIDGGEPAHPHMLRPQANIHPRGCGTH